MFSETNTDIQMAVVHVILIWILIRCLLGNIQPMRALAGNWPRKMAGTRRRQGEPDSLRDKE